ncbi:MAG: hypothetical protein ABFS30_09310 [Pseudomonadota bacterium]
MGQIEAIVKNQRRFDPAIGQKQPAIELGQTCPVFGHEFRSLLLSLPLGGGLATTARIMTRTNPQF